MTDNIVSIGDYRAKHNITEPEHPPFTIEGYETETVLVGRDRPWAGAELMQISRDLRLFARSLEDCAATNSGKPLNQVLADIQFHEDGLITFWLHDRVHGDEHRQWVVDLCEAAKSGLPPSIDEPAPAS